MKQTDGPDEPVTTTSSPRPSRLLIVLAAVAGLGVFAGAMALLRPDPPDPPDAPAPAEAPAAAAPAPLDARVETMREAYGVAGLAVVVVRGQQTLLSRGFGAQADGTPYTAQTPGQLYSATKALSSLVYASLAEDGLIDLDARLGDLLDDAPSTWATIPFYRLLNHSSGITMIINRPEFEPLQANPASTNRDIYDVVRKLPFDYPPGEASRYRQSGYAIAEMIISDELGKTWPELVEEHVTKPAGATATVHAHLASGARTSPLLASAGWYQTTADDMAAVFKALNAGRIVTPKFLEDLLYRAEYDFDGYSLGSVLEVIDGVRTVGHQGGGARATIRYVPSRAVGVAVFTDSTQNNNLAVDLADLVVREIGLGQPTKLPIAVPLLGMKAASAAEIIARYSAESTRPDSEYDLRRAEGTLNRLGYGFIRQKRLDDAVQIFALNVREHPESANTHDSLGEAYFERGDLDLALASYRRALELAPSNHHAQEMIGRIEAARGSEP